MLQFLRFDAEKISESEFSIITGKEALKFFAKKTLTLIIFAYSTIFLPVALPFVKTPFIPMYFIGGMATAFYFIRFINYIVKYFQYKGGKIRVVKDAIELTDASKTLRVPADSITYLEANILGNFLVREKYAIHSFPLMLLPENDREALRDIFHDMAPKRTALYRKIWEFIDAIAVALVLAVHIIQFIIQAYYIPTGSMMDTLLVGDHLFVEKITYGPIIPRMFFMDGPIHLDVMSIRDIQRGDIVIFRPPHEIDKDYIKRCIAVPGDRFEIKNNAVYINGQRMDEPYTKGPTRYTFGINKSRNIEGIVPQGKIIVLGDNRENSQDGRFFGYLDISRVKGRAFVLYWNWDQIRKFDFSRFGLIR